MGEREREGGGGGERERGREGGERGRREREGGEGGREEEGERRGGKIHYIGERERGREGGERGREEREGGKKRERGGEAKFIIYLPSESCKIILIILRGCAYLEGALQVFSGFKQTLLLFLNLVH